MSESTSPQLGLFDAYGIELEYMLVDRRSLAVRPVADKLLEAFTGGEPTDYDEGPVGWSNELALHVIELKTNGPTPALAGWAAKFEADLGRMDEALEALGARVMPGAMHPTMDPRRETVLWPHEYSEVYSAYHRIFDCFRHGWANLQSCHINLPFAGDAEFERLHAAIRVALPLMPALAASSPVLDGRVTGVLDNRLDVYCTHQSRIPEAMGLVVPEVLRSRAEYEQRIFEPLRTAAARLDPDGLLKHEFLNARGAIARFQRGAIEIRVLDVQETPRADLAIALAVTAVVRALAEERWVPIARLHELSTESLAWELQRVYRDGDQARVEHAGLLAALGRSGPLTAGDLWRQLVAELRGAPQADRGDWEELGPTVDEVLRRGPLARRLITALGEAPDARRIHAVWLRLADCLARGELF
ncbi:MAG: glutamate-cysteine ligase family protein [Planctomycetota bacterium]